MAQGLDISNFQQNLRNAVSQLEGSVNILKNTLNTLGEQVSAIQQKNEMQDILKKLYETVNTLKTKVEQPTVAVLPSAAPTVTSPVVFTPPVATVGSVGSGVPVSISPLTTTVEQKKEPEKKELEKEPEKKEPEKKEPEKKESEKKEPEKKESEKKESEKKEDEKTKAEKTLSSFELYNVIVIIVTFVFSIILDVFIYRYQNLLDEYNVNSQHIIIYILLTKYSLLLIIILLYLLNYGFYENKKALTILMFLAILAISGLIVFFVVKLFQMIQLEVLKQKAFDAYINSYLVISGTIIILALNLVGTVGSFVMKIKVKPKGSCPLEKPQKESTGKKSTEIEMKEMK
jgi:cation transport ATPase